GYVISVPYNSATYTYEAGPQFNYRGMKKVTLFVRPALGALHANVTVKPGDPIAKLLVGGLLGTNLTRSDTVVFYGFGGGATWEITPNFGLRVATDVVHYNFFSNLLNGGRNSVRVVVRTKFSFGKNILGKQRKDGGRLPRWVRAVDCFALSEFQPNHQSQTSEKPLPRVAHKAARVSPGCVLYGLPLASSSNFRGPHNRTMLCPRG